MRVNSTDVFHVDRRFWTSFQSRFPATGPRERAFHTATVIGNYMVVYGERLQKLAGRIHAVHPCVYSSPFLLLCSPRGERTQSLPRGEVLWWGDLLLPSRLSPVGVCRGEMVTSWVLADFILRHMSHTWRHTGLFSFMNGCNIPASTVPTVCLFLSKVGILCVGVTHTLPLSWKDECCWLLGVTAALPVETWWHTKFHCLSAAIKATGCVKVS